MADPGETLCRIFPISSNLCSNTLFSATFCPAAPSNNRLISVTCSVHDSLLFKKREGDFVFNYLVDSYDLDLFTNSTCHFWSWLCSQQLCFPIHSVFNLDWLICKPLILAEWLCSDASELELCVGTASLARLFNA